MPTTLNKKGGQTEGGKRQYISQRLVRSVAEQLSERDRRLVEAIAELHLASGRQLRTLLYDDTDAGRRLARLDLARLTDWRVLARLERRIGGVRAGSDGYVYALDTIGQRLTYPDGKRPRRPWTPGPSHIRHVLAVGELYTALNLRQRAPGPFEVRRFDTEPRCWRTYHGPGGRRLTLKPDAFTVVRNHTFEDHYFIEVDMATESLPRICDKAEAYVSYWQTGFEQERHGVYPQILWITPDERRRRALVEALTELDPGTWQLFAVSTAGDAADYIASGVRA